MKTGIQHLHRLSTGLSAVKNDLPNYYKPSTAFVAVRTHLTNYYRCLTNFAGDKTGLTIAYRASTALKKSKQDYETSPGLWKSKMFCQASTVLNKLCGSQRSFVEPYRPSTGFAMVKMYLLNIYKPLTDSVLQHHPPQAFNRLCSSQNWPAEPLLAINISCSSQNRHDDPVKPYICGSQTWLGEHLQAFNMLCGSPNWLAEQQKTFN